MNRRGWGGLGTILSLRLRVGWGVAEVDRGGVGPEVWVHAQGGEEFLLYQRAVGHVGQGRAARRIEYRAVSVGFSVGSWGGWSSSSYSLASRGPVRGGMLSQGDGSDSVAGDVGDGQWLAIYARSRGLGLGLGAACSRHQRWESGVGNRKSQIESLGWRIWDRESRIWRNFRAAPAMSSPPYHAGGYRADGTVGMRLSGLSGSGIEAPRATEISS